MYLRAVHAELDTAALREFVANNPLGILITAFSSSTFPTIQCTHIPWVLDTDDKEDPDNLGTLRGHLARANPHAKSMTQAVQAHDPSNGCLEQDVSVLFTGPAHSYVTPKFYVKTKPETGKVVPTWNYSAVQATGKAKIYWDNNEETSSFLQQQISDLTDKMESATSKAASENGNSARPWQVTDAPTNYIELLKRSIVGIEIKISLLEGKHKMSQEMGEDDRSGIVAGFEALNTDLGLKIADTVRAKAPRSSSHK